MHDICPFAKNPCRKNLYSPNREQFMCAKNTCFTVVDIFAIYSNHKKDSNLNNLLI